LNHFTVPVAIAKPIHQKDFKTSRSNDRKLKRARKNP